MIKSKRSMTRMLNHHQRYKRPEKLMSFCKIMSYMRAKIKLIRKKVWNKRESL
jgi:hypothetical protein